MAESILQKSYHLKRKIVNITLTTTATASKSTLLTFTGCDYETILINASFYTDNSTQAASYATLSIQHYDEPNAKANTLAGNTCRALDSVAHMLACNVFLAITLTNVNRRVQGDYASDDDPFRMIFGNKVRISCRGTKGGTKTLFIQILMPETGEVTYTQLG